MKQPFPPHMLYFATEQGRCGTWLVSRIWNRACLSL